MEQRRARGMLAAAAVIFGTLAPFVRGISVSSGELALYRAVMAALLVGGYLLVSGQKLALRANRREAALLLLSGTAMGVNWILLFEAYRYTTVSVATLSYYFAPVLVTAACPLLFHERLTGKQIVCFVMSTLGLVLVIGVGGFRGGADVRGVIFGLGAAAFYAAVILLNKFIRSVAGIQRTFLQFLAAIVILIPYVAATGGVSLGTLDARGWVCLLIVGFFHTGVTYCLYFSALRELPGQEVALLSYMDPLVAVIVSVTVLGEPVQLADRTYAFDACAKNIGLCPHKQNHPLGGWMLIQPAKRMVMGQISALVATRIFDPKRPTPEVTMLCIDPTRR